MMLVLVGVRFFATLLPRCWKAHITNPLARSCAFWPIAVCYAPVSVVMMSRNSFIHQVDINDAFLKFLSAKYTGQDIGRDGSSIRLRYVD